MRRLAIMFATMTLLLAACAGETAGTPDSTIPVDGGTIGDVDQQMINDVLAQASQETGVSLDGISVVTAEAVTWSDGSIGCPEEGMGYTQALVPGYRVVLDVDGEQMHFHAGQDGQFRACDNPQEPIDNGTDDQ